MKHSHSSNINRNAPQSLKDEPFYGLELDEEQEKFRDALWDKEKLIVFCNSKAGTGKTTIALGTANLLYSYGMYKEVIYIVSPTQEQIQGFLPGDQEQKTAPYMGPLLDAMAVLGIDAGKSLISDTKPDKISPTSPESLVFTLLNTSFEKTAIFSCTLDANWITSLAVFTSKLATSSSTLVLSSCSNKS